MQDSKMMRKGDCPRITQGCKMRKGDCPRMAAQEGDCPRVAARGGLRVAVRVQ